MSKTTNLFYDPLTKQNKTAALKNGLYYFTIISTGVILTKLIKSMLLWALNLNKNFDSKKFTDSEKFQNKMAS